jgi:hypothetical protein
MLKIEICLLWGGGFFEGEKKMKIIIITGEEKTGKSTTLSKNFRNFYR